MISLKVADFHPFDKSHEFLDFTAVEAEPN